jgi:hypothetical protein
MRWKDPMGKRNRVGVIFDFGHFVDFTIPYLGEREGDKYSNMMGPFQNASLYHQIPVVKRPAFFLPTWR